MASSMPRLLCYGHDEMLQFTRMRILEKEFSVAMCNTLTGLARLLSLSPLDLVLMCQSVPEQECDEVIELSRAAWPAVKILLLHETAPGFCSVHSDATMDSLEGPPALLHEIHALLETAAGENAAPVSGLSINHVQ